MTIYTKKGDKGNTSTINSKERISKDSIKVEALGSIDELNSFLGVASSFSEDEGLKVKIEKIQYNLLKIGSIIAGSKLRISSKETKDLEKEIDQIEGNLPVLKNFVFPGGTRTASLLHYVRAISRRTERCVVRLGSIENIDAKILTYLNRLSDYLFMLTRVINSKQGVGEKIWKAK